MKKLMTLTAMVLILSSGFYAKETPFAVGFGVSDSAGNLGLNLEASSPSFAQDFLIIRLESQIDFLSAYRNNPDVEWEMFSTHRLGLVGTGGWNSDTIRLYGEFGPVLALPCSTISDDTMQWGIYGLFGFEFFIASKEESTIAYYLEAGTNALFDSADNIAGDPDYYSGFTARTGIRFYF